MNTRSAISLSGFAGSGALANSAAGSLRGRPGKRLGQISRAHVVRTASYSFTAAGRVPAAVLPARTSCGCCPGSGRFRRPSLFEEGCEREC
jgi:hypothetical protein